MRAHYVLTLLFLLFSTACSGSDTLVGVIRMTPEIQRNIGPKAVLFLVARPAGETKGPPLAVKRFGQPFSFPLEFSLSGENTMVPNTPFKGKVMLTARVAQSGSAMPPSAGDIESAPLGGPVEIGTGKPVEIEMATVR